jgi:hypothetical protein
MPIFHRTPANQTVQPVDDFEWLDQEIERRVRPDHRLTQALKNLVNRHKRQNPLDYTQNEDLRALERDLLNRNALGERAKRAVRKILSCSRSGGNASSAASVDSRASGFNLAYAARLATRTARSSRQQPHGRTR